MTQLSAEPRIRGPFDKLRVNGGFVVACALLLVACRGKEPPHLSWNPDPQALDNPFPDARLLGSDGGLAFRPQWYQPFLAPKALIPNMISLLNGWADGGTQVEGVGMFGGTMLLTSDPVDATTLSGIATRLVQTSSGYQVLESNVGVEPSTQALANTTVTPSAQYPQFILVRPTVPLPSGASGLLVITGGMKTTSGVPFGRGYAFNDAHGSSELIDAAAKALGVKSDEILLALPQVAPDALGPMKALASWTATMAAPSYTIPAHGVIATPDGNGQMPVGVWKSTDTDWTTMTTFLDAWSFANPANDVGEVIVGTFQSHDLRGADGTFTAANVQSPDSAPTQDLYFVLSVPAIAKPSGGYHVVIGGHGLNGRNTPELNNTSSFCLSVAEVLAQKGMACLGIDAVDHGTRGNTFNFFSVSNLNVARDNFRQMAVDQMQLSRLAAALDLDGDGTPDLAPDIGYFGNSLGSIMGANFMALDPRVKYGVLNVAGGGLSTILTGPTIRDEIGLLISAETNLPYQSEQYYSAFPLFEISAQLFIDPGDPINLANGFSARGNAVLIQEGLGDQTIPNVATDNLARSMGVPAATAPASGTAPIDALDRVNPQQYGKPANYNGHNIFWDIPQVRTQVQTFLSSDGTQLVIE